MRPAFLPLLQPMISPFSGGLSLGNRLSIGPTIRTTAFLETAATTTTNIATANDIPASALDILLSPETVLPPINAVSEQWVRSLVWLDFKVAVTFFVVAPLILLSWAVVIRIPPNDSTTDNKTVKGDSLVSLPISETILRYMTSYWQASSLLLLTLFLDIQEETACVVCGLLAQAMIVASLWWWEDLNEELMENSDSNDASIGKVFVLWRNMATLAASTGVIIQVPFQTCIGASSLIESSWCAPWVEPPKFAAGLIGISASPTLELLTLSGLVLYTLVLVYYVIVLIPSVGRSGRAARPKAMNVATPIGVWQRMGFLEDQNSE